MKKQCIACQKELTLKFFYRHSEMSDGHFNVCKECAKRRALRYREANLDKVRVYDRERGRDPKRLARNKLNYRKRTSTPEGRLREWKRRRDWDARNKFKKNVRAITRYAIKSGILIPEPCERCGNDKVHAHHEDYTKPLDVVWLCVPCHGERHREINEEERQ